MENLNDLIWTDEDGDENSAVSTQGSEMTRVCMIAFCGIGVAVILQGTFMGAVRIRHTER